MGGYAQATTNGAGLRLIAGMDLWGMKIQATGKRIDVWKLQSSPYLKGQKLVLGDLLGLVGKFDQLARFAVSEGHDLREPVLMRKGASHQRLQVGEKEYLKQSYRFYQRDVAGED
tara:strand:+ start:117 stop:461 length:345 start_codon:yes stop_codon:yes gene_type:complete